MEEQEDLVSLVLELLYLNVYFKNSYFLMSVKGINQCGASDWCRASVPRFATPSGALT